jgi:hypothetical protein
MFYRMIAKANIVVERVPAIEMDASLQSRVIGEAKFLRALAYFYINALWGGGPLRTEKNSTELMMPRAAPAEIWSLIEQDLTDAIAALPQQYEPEDAGRATWGAARSLLGKAYLYQKRWADAEAEFDEVISSGVYQLEGEDATSVEEAIAAMRGQNPARQSSRRRSTHQSNSPPSRSYRRYFAGHHHYQSASPTRIRATKHLIDCYAIKRVFAPGGGSFLTLRKVRIKKAPAVKQEPLNV